MSNKLLRVLMSLLIGFIIGSSFVKTPPKSSAAKDELIKVKRVIDGDTIEIETGQKVRYIGIDTPELHNPKKPVGCFGQEAMEKNKQLVEGKIIRLEKDVSNTDKYGRLLRYVYLDDKTASIEALFVNLILVREGYATSSTFPPDVKYATVFLEAQTSARENKMGLWEKCQ